MGSTNQLDDLEEEPEYYTVSETSKLLGVCATTIRRWDNEGLIRCLRTAGGHRRIPRSEVLRVQLLRTSGENIRAHRVDKTEQSEAVPSEPSFLSEGTPLQCNGALTALRPLTGVSTGSLMPDDVPEGPQSLGALKTPLKILRILLISPLLRPLSGLVVSWLVQLIGQVIELYEELQPLKPSWLSSKPVF